jgi:multicomponent Na+:H+ antiporter subunit A
LIYETGLESGARLTAAIVLMGLFNVFVAGVVGIGPFWGGKIKTPKKPHEAPISLWLGPALLVGLSVYLGIFPSAAASLMVSPAASGAAGEAVKVKLALWHGVNTAFLLSIGTVVAGIGLFAVRNPMRSALQKLEWKWGPARLYDLSLDGLMSLARGQTRILQSGYMRYYLLTIAATVVAGGGYTLLRAVGINLYFDLSDVRFYEAALAILIVAAALAAVATPSRLGAIAALGAAGYSIALIYVVFGAPDLAMTQFAIESLTVILFVLAFYHLPKFQQLSPRRSRIRDIVVALLAGSLMTLLVMAAVTAQIAEPISRYFVENAVPLAHGRNIVNVILVDFRGIDTLGEITVLGIAAIGVYALLKLRRGRGRDQ